jgi:hypothetical protein
MPIAVIGLQRPKEFADPLLNGIGEMNLPRIERCVVGAAQELLAQFPDIKAFVCECHNLPPFSAAIRRQTRKPVFDILTLVGAALRAQEPAEFSACGLGLPDARDGAPPCAHHYNMYYCIVIHRSGRTIWHAERPAPAGANS